MEIFRIKQAVALFAAQMDGRGEYTEFLTTNSIDIAGLLKSFRIREKWTFGISCPIDRRTAI